VGKTATMRKSPPPTQLKRINQVGLDSSSHLKNLLDSLPTVGGLLRSIALSTFDLMKNRITLSFNQKYSTPLVGESILFSAFRRIWQNWLTELRRNTEPHLWQTSDPWGNTWWHAYHPATGNTATRESEVEILLWIDQYGVD
jgi:hypothetical protein